MKTKTTQIIPFLIALLGFAFAPVSYWCIYSNGYCYATWVHHIYPYFTNPLYSFSFVFLIVAIFLVFIPRNIFNSWLKLAAWTIPLAIIFIASTPVIDTSLLPFSRDDAARLAGGVFAAASIILIVWKHFSTRHSEQI